MYKRVYVIVVTYKGQLWYERCFSSLKNSNYPVTTVVVDNASNDGTVEFIESYYPESHLIRSNVNLGFGRANNLGIKYAMSCDCDYVFLLNQDAWIEPDTIGNMLIAHTHHQDYGVLGCINITKEKDHVLDGFMPYVFNPKNCDPTIFDDLYFSRLKEVYDIKTVLAAAWLIPISTLLLVGGFDPIFFHYGEDDNYLQRVYYHNLKVGICPKCPIVHDTQTKRVAEAIVFRSNDYAQKRNWLLEWCDINQSDSFIRRVGCILLSSAKSMLHFNFKGVSYEFQKLLYFIKKYKSIKRSRMINETTGPHYLV